MTTCVLISRRQFRPSVYFNVSRIDCFLYWSERGESWVDADNVQHTKYPACERRNVCERVKKKWRLDKFFHFSPLSSDETANTHMNHLNPRFLCHPSQLLEKSLPRPRSERGREDVVDEQHKIQWQFEICYRFYRPSLSLPRARIMWLFSRVNPEDATEIIDSNEEWKSKSKTINSGERTSWERASEFPFFVHSMP